MYGSSCLLLFPPALCIGDTDQVRRRSSGEVSAAFDIETARASHASDLSILSVNHNGRNPAEHSQKEAWSVDSRHVGVDCHLDLALTSWANAQHNTSCKVTLCHQTLPGRRCWPLRKW